MNNDKKEKKTVEFFDTKTMLIIILFMLSIILAIQVSDKF